MFEGLINFFNKGEYTKGIFMIFLLCIILGLMLWVSIIDIKKMSVTFWKMLITSSSIIICPLIWSFFCGCPYLKYFLMSALILWVLFLIININFNKNKILGQADVDLTSAIVSECIMTSAWMIYVKKDFPELEITHLWMLFVLYFLIGSLMLLFLIILKFSISWITRNSRSPLKELRHKKIPAIPMFIPMAIMIPYNIMIL